MGDDWEGGRHQGVSWRRIGAAALVLVLVAAGVYLVRRDRGLQVETDGAPITGPQADVEVVVTQPLQAGDRWYCPSDFPVRVYDDGLFFPPEHPGAPGQHERPADCYADRQRAEQDGYSLAPPPPGSQIAGGVYLLPTVAPTRENCAELAAAVGFTVPCPRLLPAPATGPSCVDSRCEYRGGAVIEQRLAGGGLPTSTLGSTHVVLTAVRLAERLTGARVAVDGPAEIVTCFPDEAVLAEGVDVVRQCPPATPWVPGIQGYPHEEHTAVFWVRDDVVYGASVEGYGSAHQELLMAIVGAIDYVEPARR